MMLLQTFLLYDVEVTSRGTKEVNRAIAISRFRHPPMLRFRRRQAFI